MTELLDVLHQLGTWSVPALWIPLLVWTVLALPVGMALRRMSRLHPLVRYRLQQALLAALPLSVLAAPWLEMPSLAGWWASIQNPSASSGLVLFLDAPTVTDSGAAPPESFSWSLYHGLGGLTLVAALLALARLTRLLRSAWALAHLTATMSTTDSSDVQALTGRLAKSLSIRRPVTTRLTSAAIVPMTFGALRPTILLPTSLADQRESLRMTLIHELIHIRRFDFIARWAEQLIAAVFVIHPGVAFLTRSIERAREMACDAEALHRSRCNRSAYADLLYGFATPSAPRSFFAVSIAETASALKERIQAMTDTNRMTSSPTRFSPLIAIVTLLAVALGVVACSDSIAPTQEGESTESATAATAQKQNEEGVFVVVEDRPELKGGMQAIQNEIQYPELAKKAGIEGRVFIQFIVDENGNVQNPHITRGAHKLLDQEALRVVRGMEFEPGQQRGEAVKVQMALPITFKLSDKDIDDSSSSILEKSGLLDAVERLEVNESNGRDREIIIEVKSGTSDEIKTRIQEAFRSGAPEGANIIIK